MDIELKKHSKISGLTLIDSFLSNDEVEKLKTFLEESKDWQHTVKGVNKSRAVLQFGYSYPYRAGAKLTKTIPIPNEFKFIIKRIQALEPTSKFHPNQVIVNRYYKNQGIMVFRQGKEAYNIKVQERSLYIMREDARYKWTHEMKKLNESKPRYSITFRKALV